MTETYKASWKMTNTQGETIVYENTVTTTSRYGRFVLEDGKIQWEEAHTEPELTEAVPQSAEDIEAGHEEVRADAARAAAWDGMYTNRRV